jgi:antitoxin ParD1/3/4
MAIQMNEQDIAKIQERVESGHYPSAEAALHEAIQLLDERDRALAQLEADIEEAQAEFDRGEGISMTRERFMEIVDRAIERARAKQAVSNAVAS